MCILSCRLDRRAAGSSCDYHFSGGPWSLGVCPRSDPIAPLHRRWGSGARRLWRERNEVVIQRMAKLLDCYPEEIGEFLRELTLQNYSRLLYPVGCGRSPCNVPLCHPTVCERYMGIFDEGGNLRDPTNPRSLFSLLYLLQRCLNGQPLGGCSGLPLNSNKKCGFEECYPRTGPENYIGLDHDHLWQLYRFGNPKKRKRVSDHPVTIVPSPSLVSTRVTVPRSSIASAYVSNMRFFQTEDSMEDSWRSRPGIKTTRTDPPMHLGRDFEVDLINIQRRASEIRGIFNDFVEQNVVHVDAENLMEAIRLVDLGDLESKSDEKRKGIGKDSANKIVDGISEFYNNVVGTTSHPKKSNWRNYQAALYNSPVDYKRAWNVERLAF